MSGHVRLGFAAFLVAAGFSTPAASNALTDFFSPNPAPEAATPAPAAAPDDCLRQPGPTAAGQHWVYRYDGHRKCWFQAAEDTAVARKPARHRVAKRRVAAPEQDKPAPRRQKAVEDAHAELVKSAPAATPQPTPPEPAAQTPQPAPSEPKLTIVHTVPVRVADAAGLVPPAPVPASPAADQLTPDQPTSDQSGPRHVDVEALLAEAPAASEAVAAAPPATPIAAPAAKTSAGEEGTAFWLGVLLMALGGAALLSASGALRRALWPVRSRDPEAELPVIAHGGRDEPSFARSASVSPASGETSLSVATRRIGPRTARARRPLAPVPTQEAF